MRIARSIAVVLFVVAGVAIAQTPPPYEFEQEVLVSVESSGALSAPPMPESTPELRIEKLFSTTSAPRPLVDGIVAAPAAERTWYRVTFTVPEAAGPRAATPHPWDLVHDALDGKSSNAALSSITAEMRRLGMRIVEIEPHVSFRFEEQKKAPESPCTSPQQPDVVALCGDYSVYWPPKLRSLGWHAADAFSQFERARAAAAPFFPPMGDPKLVTVAHLDTGYDKAGDMSRPVRLDLDASITFYPKDTGDCGLTSWPPSTPLPGCDRFTTGFGLTPGHGPSTLSILAGNRVSFPGGGGFPPYNDFLGGAPLARIVSLRVSPTVILLWPGNVASAIKAMAGKADVISMSMGGVPSGALRDAVNDAYENGTAMFFATGDFVRIPAPFVNLHSPRSMVYPARFSRTTPVAGVTESGESYGEGPGFLTLLFHGFRQTGSWILRGSYGPASKMRHAISAYTPNVAKHYANAAGITNVIAPNFEGTSAATPQAAAAAALWLQVHRDKLDPHWRTWKKTEAVYHALLESARPVESVKFFGAGALKANDALAKMPNLDLPPRPRATIGRDWITVIAKIIGGVESTRLHEQGLRTEILQLVATSPRLIRLVEERDIDFDAEKEPSPEVVDELRAELVRDTRASRFLKAAVLALGPVKVRGRIRVAVIPIVR